MCGGGRIQQAAGPKDAHPTIPDLRIGRRRALGINRSFDLLSGGYVQWTRVEGRGTPVHVEINEGTFDTPMPRETWSTGSS